MPSSMTLTCFSYSCPSPLRRLSHRPCCCLGRRSLRFHFDTTSIPARSSSSISCNSSLCPSVLYRLVEDAGQTEGSSIISGYVERLSAEQCLELLSRNETDKNSIGFCLRLFERLRLQKPSLLTPAACSLMFKMLGKAEMGDQLMSIFESLILDCRNDCLTVDQFNALLSGLVHCRRYDDAWKSCELMEATNVSPNHVTCLIMLTALRETGKKSKDMWNLFENMNRKGVEWCPEISCELMKSFCDDGLRNEGLIILVEMEKKGFSADVLAYNILMDAYCQFGQIAEAEGLFAEMKVKGLKLTPETFNIFIKAYALRMQPEIVEKLLLEMQEAGLEPNAQSYSCLISAYGKQKKTCDMAVDAFLRMKKAGISASLPCYNALIQAYAAGGCYDMAYVTFENMLADRISPSIQTYTNLIAAFRWEGDPDTMLKIWSIMRLEQVEVTPKIYHMLLDGLAKRGLFTDAMYVFGEMERSGLVPTVVTFNILLNAYARGGEHSKLPQLLKEMESRSLKADSVSYVTVISAYVRSKDFRRALLYHKLMVKHGQLPDPESYEKLRAALDVKAGRQSKKNKNVILKILNSKFGSVKSKKRGKKDEFWKSRAKRMPKLESKRATRVQPSHIVESDVN